MKAYAYAPVNIAWIKYMGKSLDDRQPTNASLSLTLDNFGTDVWMESVPGQDSSSDISLEFDSAGYVPPVVGQEKLIRYLSKKQSFESLLHEIGVQPIFHSKYKIKTLNRVPAASGIATSASSYAAYTLAYLRILTPEHQQVKLESAFKNDDFVKKVANLAAQGSGSACRSLMNGFVEWVPGQGISRVNPGLHFPLWVDLLCLVDTEPKTVSSSEAHERVRTSPQFLGRSERAHGRLNLIKTLMKSDVKPDESFFKQLQKMVWDEAQDMHELFHTSTPPFRYQTQMSLSLAHYALNQAQSAPSAHALVTLDAGANVHIFVPVDEMDQWMMALKKNFPSLNILVGHSS